MIHSYRLECIFMMLLCLWVSNAQSDTLSVGATEIVQTAKDGFSQTEELKHVYVYLETGNIAAAFNEVSHVLKSLHPGLKTSRRARFVSAIGHLLRAEIREDLGHAQELILADEQAAANLGSRSGYYKASARSLVLLRYNNFQSGEAEPPSREDIEAGFRSAAELGGLDSASMIETIAQGQGKRVEQTYWGFITRVNEDKIRFTENYGELKNLFSVQDIEEMKQGIARYGLTGSPTIAVLDNLPGRSVFTVYQLDHQLRKKLDFIWRAFFADNRERDNSTVLDSYLALKSIMADGIVSELYLLVPGGSRADLPKLVAIPRSDVSKFISAGDEIAVRCGSDDHQASVWRVDEDAGLVFLLDPFYEFWTPEQAPCTPSFRHISYKYGRKLVSIKLDELRPMVLAIFTLRDARQD